MITENAKVVSVDESGTYVATSRKTACGQCAARKGCSTSVLSKVVGKKLSVIRVVNEIDAKEGDEVMIGIHESSLVKGASIVYLLPLILMFAGAIIGDLFSGVMQIKHELLTVLFSAAGFYLGLRKVKIYFINVSECKEFQPEILAKSGQNLFAVSSSNIK